MATNITDSINVVEIQLEAWREQMLNRLLPFTLILASIGIIVGVISVAAREKWGYIPIYTGAYLLLFLITLNRRLSYRPRAGVLLFLLATLGIAVLMEAGLSGEGRSFLIILPIAAQVLLGWRYALASLALSTCIFLGFGWLASTSGGRGEFINWMLAATLSTMLVTGVVISLRALLQNLINTLQQELKGRRQLREISDFLEQKVAERTQELERRSAYLTVGAEITQAVGALHDVNKLLQQVAHLILEKLALYHVGIFTLDQFGQFAVLQAAAGEAGQQLLVQGHRLKVDERSTVGWCVSHRQARIAPDVNLGHPLLPDTRSEMALPLRVGKRVIGALDVQSTRPAAFDESDMSALQGMADQVAIVLENANLFQQMDAAFQDMEAANQASTLRAWREYGLSGSPGFAEFHQPNQPAWSETEVETLSNDDPSLMAIPLVSRGVEIGQLLIEPPPDRDGWSDVERDILHSVAAQATGALERARLLQESQLRVAREQAINQMTVRFVRTLDVDTMLQTAARELGQLLQVDEVSVHVGSPPAPADDGEKDS